MNPSPRHARPRKIRRTGRHTTPSQVRSVADKAGKAAPAMAIAGAVFAAAPQAHAAVTAQARTVAVAAAGANGASGAAGANGAQARAGSPARSAQADQSYTVRPGDTLSSIARRFYGDAADWPRLYQANRAVIRDPGLIYPGQVLRIPGRAADAYRPRHARASVLTSSSSLAGTLSCGGLEELWEQAGGADGEAVMAASIAMAESSGRQYATGAAGERGYWQINPDHGALSTYDPLGNAKAAVIISADGTDWTPWTTYTSGAYRGRC